MNTDVTLPKMTGLDKAALLLLTLGEDVAAQILQIDRKTLYRKLQKLTD